MTRPQGTFLLLCVAVGLLGYILVFERHRPGAEARADLAQAILPDLDPARVIQVTIVQTNGSLRAERVQGQWQLADPAYPAQSLLIENWIAGIARLKRASHLEASDLLAQPGGLAALGLEPPRVSLTLDQGAQRFQLRIGSRTPLGNRMYVQAVGRDGVDITDAQPLERLPTGAVDWRDPALLNLTGLRFDRLHMRSPSREFEVQRASGDAQWRLTRPRPARADAGRVEQLLQELQATRITRFATDFAGADLEPFGLQPPAASLTLAAGTNLLLSLDLGHSPTNAPELVYARRSTLPGVITVPRRVLELVAVPYTDLLDYRLMELPTDGVDRIEFGAAEPVTLQRQPEGGWRITQPREMPADPALVSLFLERLRGLRIQEVAKEVVTELDLPTYGLQPPFRYYGLAWPAPPQPGSTSTVFRLDFGTNQADRVFARRSDENPVYFVAMADALRLPQAAFELRDRRLWNFTTNQVASVTIGHQGKTYKFLRSPGGQWSVAPGSQGMVNTFALEEAVHRLGNLRAGFWRAQGATFLESFGIPQINHHLLVELSQNGQTQSLRLDFGATSPSGGPFTAITLEGGPTVFELPLDVVQPYNEVVRSMGLQPNTGP